MMMAKAKRIYLFLGFERLWHWTQVLLCLGLVLTGFSMHGTWHLTDFHTAWYWHTRFGWALAILFAIEIFWLLTTGQWKNYIPTTQKIKDVAMYYMVGIFKGEPHPYHPHDAYSKLNPLQRLAYLGIQVVLVPLMVLTGLLMIYYNKWPQWGISLRLGPVAILHTIGAFLVIMFVIGHVYLTTTGHTWYAHILAMITGWEELPEGEGVDTA